MKKVLYLLVVASIMSTSAMASVVSTSSGNIFTNMAYLSVSMVNQDPISADPGSYVDLLFKVENRGTLSADNVTMEIMPQYPFSLDQGVSAITSIGTMNSVQIDSNAQLVRYTLRVDGDAIDGDNEIGIRYSYGNGESSSIQKFNVSVSNSKTDFEIVAQDSTTFAIANVGSNTASSVIVSMPQQNGFAIVGASSNIIGNLDAGDYTLATFQLSPLKISNSTISSIKVDVSYTDTLGIRRTVEKIVPFSFSASPMNVSTTGTFVQRQAGSGSNNGLMYVAIGIVGIAIIVAAIKIKTRKRK